MLYVDLKYIATVGIHLRNFKKKKDRLFNCSCPVCGDSEKKKTKARGYFYQKGNSMLFKCHNCSAGMGIANFLKTHFPAYHKQYILEKYRSTMNESPKARTETVAVPKVVLRSFSSSIATRVSDLPDAHYAKQYVLKRKIPVRHFNRIYFTENFAALVDEQFPGVYSNLPANEHRLIIPFFDAQNKLVGLQGRSFAAEKALRYITIRATSQVSLVYGLDRFDATQEGYVVEGPIDSLFLPNCLAAANSDLQSVEEKISAPNKSLVFIYDNEPRNREIVKLMSQAIDQGKKVCIWPSNVAHKDINEIIMSGLSEQDVLDIVRRRTFCGLEAQLQFSLWKKI